MKTYPNVGFAMIAGIGLAAVMVQSVQAQAKKRNYEAPPVSRDMAPASKDLGPEPRGDDLDIVPARLVNCGNSASNRCASWTPGGVNDCRIRDARVTVRDNGTVSWFAVVRSSSGGDSYCTSLSFRDINGTPVFNFPRICQDLTEDDREWRRDNLGVPAILVPSITHVARVDHC